MGILDFLNPAKPVIDALGSAVKFVGERVLPPKKMSEIEKSSHYVQLFGISESSTDSARQMFITAMQTQKQPYLIRVLNGVVRPLGGIGALITFFYTIWGENLAIWFEFVYRPIKLSIEDYLLLGSIIAFYFGSRLKETLTGVTTRR
uniref:Holin n=1 Tax=viral metagenome TaxID=1070528 RepID=A0A6M3KZ14_9ZZZZ